MEKVIRAHPAYGIRRLKAELEQQYQLKVGRDTLGKLLKFWGLQLRRKVKAKNPNMIQKILQSLAGRTNLLIRTKVAQPFQAISSDITELNFGGGKAYLCVHKDVFGQMVYGFSLSLNKQTQLVTASFRMAINTIRKLTKRLTKKLKAKPLFHQDRGSQYTSYQYVQAVLDKGILSYSDPATPSHNPGQESFFGRLKDEWRDEIAEIETFEQLEKFVKQKITYYNYERRHTSIGLTSPYKFTKQFLKNQR